MDELENLDTYNGVPEYNSWVVFDYHENTSDPNKADYYGWAAGYGGR